MALAEGIEKRALCSIITLVNLVSWLIMFIYGIILMGFGRNANELLIIHYTVIINISTDI